MKPFVVTQGQDGRVDVWAGDHPADLAARLYEIADGIVDAPGAGEHDPFQKMSVPLG